MTARTQKSHEGEGLSRKSKFALLLAAIFLLALPLFAAANSSAVQSLLNPVVTQIQAVFSSADDAFVPNESPAIVTGGISSLSSSGIRPEATTFSGGGWHSAAVKDDGTLWSWGENWFGQTGLDIGPGDQETPAQVGTATNWAQVSAGGWHSLAIRTDGTLWAWGATENGGTGLGPLVTGDQLTPAQVGSATNWTQVSAGNWHSHGIRADGTLWAWGINAVGQIGLGVAGEQLVPAQVGTDTNWAAVSAGPFHSLGIRSDGTLWSWGGNMFAATGLDTTTGNQTTPAQVGTATDWVQVSAGERYSLA
ncbi:MAG: hypothetical protein FWF11_01860, partial [Coriobacteriia bacterium]|nr:hypothetical protein [Coriobacteriia bacterium]